MVENYFWRLCGLWKVTSTKYKGAENSCNAYFKRRLALKTCILIGIFCVWGMENCTAGWDHVHMEFVVEMRIKGAEANIFTLKTYMREWTSRSELHAPPPKETNTKRWSSFAPLDTHDLGFPLCWVSGYTLNNVPDGFAELEVIL